MKTELLKILLALSSAFPISAYCDALLERQATSVTRQYDNDDQITLTCDKNLAKCEIHAVFDSYADTRPVDFGAVGVTPLLDTVRMFVQLPSQKMYTVVTGVKCQREEEDLLSGESFDAAECYVEFSVINNKIEWSNVQVLPIANMDLYHSLKEASKK